MKDNTRGGTQGVEYPTLEFRALKLPATSHLVRTLYKLRLHWQLQSRFPGDQKIVSIWALRRSSSFPGFSSQIFFFLQVAHSESQKAFRVQKINLITFENLCKKVRVVFIIKRRITAKKNIWDNAYAPHVHRLAVGFLSQHFRSCQHKRSYVISIVQWDRLMFPRLIRLATLTDVAWCPARCRHHPRILHFGKTKITNHNFWVFVWTVV